MEEAKLKPRVVMTENGGEFEKEFRAGLKKMKIRQLFGIPNRSNSQAHVERFNKSLQSSLQKDLTASRRKDWFNLVQDHVDFYNDGARAMALKATGGADCALPALAWPVEVFAKAHVQSHVRRVDMEGEVDVLAHSIRHDKGVVASELAASHHVLVTSHTRERLHILPP